MVVGWGIWLCTNYGNYGKKTIEDFIKETGIVINTDKIRQVVLENVYLLNTEAGSLFDVVQ